jgi:hypothetical protein
VVSAGGTDLVLAGHRVRVTGEDTGLLGDAVSVLVPPCALEPVTAREPGWHVDVAVAAVAVRDTGETGHPVLSWPDSGMRLTVLDAGGTLRVAARYRAASPPAVLEVERLRRRTRVVIPDGDLPSRRWPDWVVRLFFGTRLLADGCLLLHAAAVRAAAADGDRALLILAGQRGGKSTLAHRACVELGARFMADDLVLLRAGSEVPEVTGWPTRVCLPAELLDGRLLAGLADRVVTQVTAAGMRRRLVVSPAEYQQLLGVARAGPAGLGGVLAVVPAGGRAGPAARATVLGAERLAAVLAGAGHVPAQRLRMLDLLGVAGAPAVTVPAQPRVPPAGWSRVLAGIPAACLELADGPLLPQLPVWQLLEPYLPWLGSGSR